MRLNEIAKEGWRTAHPTLDARPDHHFGFPGTEGLPKGKHIIGSRMLEVA